MDLVRPAIPHRTHVQIRIDRLVELVRGIAGRAVEPCGHRITEAPATLGHVTVAIAPAKTAR